MFRFFRNLFIFVICVFILDQSSFAETFNVSNVPDLRLALQEAGNNGEDDTIILADGNYNTTYDMYGPFIYVGLEKYDITIRGSSPDKVMVSGGNNHQVFNFSEQAHNFDNLNVYIENISIVNGYTTTNVITGSNGGGIYVDGTLNINNCVIDNNKAFNGGGFYADIVVANESMIINNTAERNGGGGSSGPKAYIENCVFMDNIASNGGGFSFGGLGSTYVARAQMVTTFIFRNNVVANNTALDGVFGAVFLSYSGFFENCTTYNNSPGNGYLFDGISNSVIKMKNEGKDPYASIIENNKKYGGRFSATPKKNIEEPNTVESFVKRFYNIVLDRDAEPEGLTYWTGSLKDKSRTGSDVAKGFIFSQEFMNRNLDNESFVTILYSAFFNREADSGGYDYWYKKLKNGKSRRDVLDGFLYSQEFYNLCEKYEIIPVNQ